MNFKTRVIKASVIAFPMFVFGQAAVAQEFTIHDSDVVYGTGMSPSGGKVSGFYLQKPRPDFIEPIKKASPAIVNELGRAKNQVFEQNETHNILPGRGPGI